MSINPLHAIEQDLRFFSQNQHASKSGEQERLEQARELARKHMQRKAAREAAREAERQRREGGQREQRKQEDK